MKSQRIFFSFVNGTLKRNQQQEQQKSIKKTDANPTNDKISNLFQFNNNNFTQS